MSSFELDAAEICKTDGEKMDTLKERKLRDSIEKKSPKDTKQKRSETDTKGEISIKSTSYRETIPISEVVFCFAVLISCLGYSFIAVYFASTKYFDQLLPDSFILGWIPGRKYRLAANQPKLNFCCTHL